MNSIRHLATLAAALALLALPARAQVPGLLNYQGKVAIGAAPFTGTGQFKFALVDATGAVTYWSNDGTSVAGSEPTTAVSRPVAKGIYSLQLGDPALTNMTTVPASVFAHGDVRLRVWFDDGTNLLVDAIAPGVLGCVVSAMTRPPRVAAPRGDGSSTAPPSPRQRPL